MREILFRGKRVDNGEWVEGNDIMHETVVGHLCLSNVGECWVSVDPETVGQFTGLRDKNGKQIFEGDILSFETMRGTISFTVYYDEECGVWQPFGDSYCGFDPKDVEVIGNIHDNPEPLEDNR